MSLSSQLLHISCAAALLLLGACSTIGEKEFSCPGRPKGVNCLSATQVYTETDVRDDVKAPAKSSTRKRIQAPQILRTGLALPAVDKPVPVRTPAQVMRVWTAPWEDVRGVLHAGGYHFIEVQSRRWNFGESSEEGQPVRFFSIDKATVETKKQDAGNKSPGTPARPVQTSMNDRKKTSTFPSTSSGASK